MGKKVLRFSMHEHDDAYNGVQDTEVTVHLPDDVSWDKMMPYFLHFLEGAGYINVVDRMTNLLGGDVYDYKTYFDGKFDGDRNV